MRTLLFATFFLVSFPVVLQAEAVPEKVIEKVVPAPVVITSELALAYQDYQLAQLRWQQYRFVELPRQRQLLDGQARLLDKELQVLKRRLRDDRSFFRVGRFSPVQTAAENNRLTLQATEQQRKILKNEQIYLLRYSRQNGQLYQLEVQRTAVRLRKILTAAKKVKK